MVALLGAAAVPTAFRLVGDRGLPWPIMAVSFVPPAALVLLALTVLALGCRRWRAAGAGMALVALNVYWLVPLYVADEVPEGTDLVAMTVNLQYGWGDAATVVEAVREHRVDVLGVTELTAPAITALQAAGLAAELPHRVLRPGELAHGSGLYSRYPVTPGEDWDGVHASPGAVLAFPTTGGIREVIVRVAHPFRTGKFSAESYRNDHDALRARLAALPPEAPAIVLGDFNATRDHAAFRRLLADGWRDASEYAGEGYTPTWSPRYWLPYLLHLDHVLINGYLGARGTDTFMVDGTDHAGVLADLVLGKR
ncbi:MAG: endonuclease/exonuclease/phosphatase family protein [Sporichthyaceae bacterium]